MLGLSGGGARLLSPGKRERCERAPGAHWPRRATLPGLDWAAALTGRGFSALVLIGLSALVLGIAAGQGGGESGWKGQVWATLGGWHQFAHSFKRHLSLQFSLTVLAGECPFSIAEACVGRSQSYGS